MELRSKTSAVHFSDAVNTQPQLLGIATFSKLVGHCFSHRPFHSEVPSSAAMSEMQTELREMKSQMLELKQLMRTSFELQLEIQRAIRQEVAAALMSACTSPSLSSMRPTSTGKICTNSWNHSQWIIFFQCHCAAPQLLSLETVSSVQRPA